MMPHSISFVLSPLLHNLRHPTKREILPWCLIPLPAIIYLPSGHRRAKEKTAASCDSDNDNTLSHIICRDKCFVATISRRETFPSCSEAICRNVAMAMYGKEPGMTGKRKNICVIWQEIDHNASQPTNETRREKNHQEQ